MAFSSAVAPYRMPFCITSNNQPPRCIDERRSLKTVERRTTGVLPYNLVSFTSFLGQYQCAAVVSTRRAGYGGLQGLDGTGGGSSEGPVALSERSTTPTESALNGEGWSEGRACMTDEGHLACTTSGGTSDSLHDAAHEWDRVQHSIPSDKVSHRLHSAVPKLRMAEEHSCDGAPLGKGSKVTPPRSARSHGSSTVESTAGSRNSSYRVSRKLSYGSSYARVPAARNTSSTSRRRTGSVTLSQQSFVGPDRSPLFPSSRARPSTSCKHLTSSMSMETHFRRGICNFLWVGSQRGVVEVRSLTHPHELLVTSPLDHQRAAVTALTQVTCDKVATGHADGLLRLMDTVSLTEFVVVQAHSGSITCMKVLPVPTPTGAEEETVALSPSRVTALITASIDGTVAKWDACTLVCLSRVGTHHRSVTTLATTSGGAFAFSGGNDGVLSMYNLMDGCEVALSREEKKCLARAQVASRRHGTVGNACDKTKSQGEASTTVPSAGESCPADKGRQTSVKGGMKPSTIVVRAAFGSSATLSDRRRAKAHENDPERRHYTPLNRRNEGTTNDSMPSYVPTGRSDNSPSVQLVTGVTDGIPNTASRDAQGSAHDFEEEVPLFTKDRAQTPYLVRGRDLAKPTVSLFKHGTASAERARLKSSEQKEEFLDVQQHTVLSVKDIRRRIQRKLHSTRATVMRVVSLRMETVIQCYEQYARSSDIGREMIERHLVSYKNPLSVSWPVDGVHTSSITAILPVEDRLLITTSRDATANVFELPTGVHLRSLQSQRRVPLLSAVLDRTTFTVLIGGGDGSMMAYDLHSPDMSPVYSVQSPATSVSAYVPLGPMAIQQIYIATATVGANAPTSQPAIHYGNCFPGKEAIQNMVCSLSCVMGVSLLQEKESAEQIARTQRLVLTSHAAVQKLKKASCLGSQYEEGQTDLYATGLQLIHMRHILLRRFSTWQRWVYYHRVLRAKRVAVLNRNRLQTCQMVNRFFRSWKRWIFWRREERLLQLIPRVPSGLTMEGTTGPQNTDGALSLGGVQSLLWRRTHQAQCSLASCLCFKYETLLLQRIYYMWLSHAVANIQKARPAISFGNLLSSYSSDITSSGNSFSWVSGVQQDERNQHIRRVLPLLHEQLRHARRKCCGRFYAMWRRWTVASRQGRLVHLELSVEVLPCAPLVRETIVRARSFYRWKDYALFVAKELRLAEEAVTLQREWITLQNVIDNPSSMQQLKDEELELETAIARSAYTMEGVSAQHQAVRVELSRLQTLDVLNVSLSCFHISTTFFEPLGRHDAEVGHSSMVKSLQSWPYPGEETSRSEWYRGGKRDAFYEDTQQCHRQVSAILCAFKGTVLQFARDDRQVMAAYEAVLRLPIVVHANSTHDNDKSFSPSSCSSPVTPNRRFRLQRSLSGSTAMSNASSTGRHTKRAGTASSNVRLSTSTQCASPYVGVTHTPRDGLKQPIEGNAPCLADVFDRTVVSLYKLLFDAAREAGAKVEGTAELTHTISDPSGRIHPINRSILDLQRVMPLSTGARQSSCGVGVQTPPLATPLSSSQTSFPPRPPPCSQTRASLCAAVDQETSFFQDSPYWIPFVSSQRQREMVALVLKMVAMFDSFTAHSVMSVSSPGSISTRGFSSIQSIPFSCLCSEGAASLILSSTSVLLQLLSPKWLRRQRNFKSLQSTLPEENTSLTDLTRATTLVAPAIQTQNVLRRPPTGCPASEVKRPALGASYDSLMIGSEEMKLASPAQCPKESTSTPIAQPPKLMKRHQRKRPPSPSEAMESICKSSIPSDSCERSLCTDGGDSQSHFSLSLGHSRGTTPRSLVHRALTSKIPRSVPYLGFRVGVGRSATSGVHLIHIKEIASTFVNTCQEEQQGPAAAAGLHVDDQLVRFAGYAVTDLAAFNTVVARHVRPDVDLPVTVLREGMQVHVTIRVGARSTTES